LDDIAANTRSFGNVKSLTYDHSIPSVADQEAAAHAAANANSTAPEAKEANVMMAKMSLSPCVLAVGYVVFDVICLGIGAVGLRASVKPSTIEAMATAAAPLVSKLDGYIAAIAKDGASALDKGKAIFNILKLIFNGGQFKAIFKAFKDSLSWWQVALYGVQGLATIVAAVATDGVAFAAEVAILLTQFGFMTADAISAYNKCK